MTDRAGVEFYETFGDRCVLLACVINVPFAPEVGQTVNILRTDYRVVNIEWSIDDADNVNGSKLRANVYCEAVKKGTNQ